MVAWRKSAGIRIKWRNHAAFIIAEMFSIVNNDAVFETCQPELLVHPSSRNVDIVDQASVADILDRIPVEHEQVGPLPLLDRAQVLRAQKLGAALGGRGDHLRWSQSRVHHQLHFPVLEKAGE